MEYCEPDVCIEREQYYIDLRSTLSKLRDNQLFAKPSKYELFKTLLIFLGHVIGEQGISPDPSKIAAINDLPRPTDQTQL